MSIAALSNQLRLALEDPADKHSREQVLDAVDEFVGGCVLSDKLEVQLFVVEEELQTVYNNVVDHTSLGHTEVFLGVLYHLRPLLSPTFIISTWFDLVLRPALREPKLPTTSVTHAKELLIFAAENEDRRHPEKVHEFRRRLMDHFLDACGSGDDILERAKLDQKQRDKRYLWKSNLKDVLVKFGLKCPVAFMTQVKAAFGAPASRLQLLTLLDCFTSDPEFELHAAVFAKHPLMNSILNSLLLDNSSTTCTIGLTMLVKLLPIFAVKAYEELKIFLPRLFVILARIICWEVLSSSDQPSTASVDDDDTHFGAEKQAEEYGRLPALELRPELGWERLELRLATSSSPPSDAYFSSLYYLFPCNLFRFLSGPAAYLQDSLESPYTVSWKDALDEDDIRCKAERLLRSRIINPRLIWWDWLKELTEPDLWASYSISQIASECVMLNIRNIALGSRSSSIETDVTPDLPTVVLPSIITTPEDNSGVPTPHPGHISLPPVKARVSLQDMITTSVTLKSSLDIDVEHLGIPWSTPLFPPGSSSPTKASIKLPPELAGGGEGTQLPSHVVDAISSLQHEVLLLRSELNFELWHSRENVRHIARLYQNHVLSKNAEADRQALHNKLRQYKAQVHSLEQELREHREQSSSAKNKYADWNTELQKKLREFREEKKAWVSEVAALRTAEKEAKALFVAQEKLLADAEKETFELRTRQKENQHKVDRLHDYERQIEQLVRMQKHWDADFQKFNARGEEIELIKSKHRQMEMLLESHEKARDRLEDEARVYRRQNQALEAKLALTQKKCEVSRRIPEAEITAIVREKSELAAANARLREDNAELKDEMDEMRAALEGLKAQLSGQRGLIYESRQRSGTMAIVP